MRLPYATLASFIAGGAAMGLATGTGIVSNPFGSEPAVQASPVISGETGIAPEEIEALEARSTELADLAKQLDLRGTSLDERDGQLQQRVAALNARETELEEANASLADKNASLQELNTFLNERQGKLDQQETALSERTEALDTREASLNGFEADLAQRAAAIDEAGKITPGAGEASTELAALTQSESDAEGVSAIEAQKETLPQVAGLDPAQTSGDAPLAQVHFESNSAALTPGGLSRAQEAAERVAELNISKIRITGHTDTAGSPSLNSALAMARAETVADVFVQAGLAREMIEVVGAGETPDMLPVFTEDGISEPLNRCVGIFAVLSGAETAAAE